MVNADGLDEATMIAIARELNNSETAFIFNGGGAGYDIEVRFFTPTREVPICGHALAEGLGLGQDPVTGNAKGPLGAYLTRYGRLAASEEGSSFVAKQGEAIGRKGYVRVSVFSEGGEPRLVKVGARPSSPSVRSSRCRAFSSWRIVHRIG